MEKLKIEKSNLINSSTYLTIDLGICLLKCLYVDHEDDGYNSDSQNPDIIFTCHIFEAKNELKELIKKIKSKISNLILYQTKMVLLCGMKSSYHRREIAEIFDCEVRLVPEMQAMSIGLRYIINHSNKDSLFYQPEKVDFPSLSMHSKSIEMFRKCWKEKTDKEFTDKINENYPVLYVNAGAVSRFILVNETGEGKEISLNTLGGATFLGLAKSLLNDNNFSNILYKAEHGDKGNVDTQRKDIKLAKDLENSPSGRYLADLTVFPFGKAMDIRSSNTLPYKFEDISQSLVGMIIESVSFFSFRVAFMTCCKSIYYGGYLFQPKAFRIEYRKFCQRLPELIRSNFLKTGMEANIGLLLMNKTNFLI